MTTPQPDPSQLLAHLQSWRQYLEQAAASPPAYAMPQWGAPVMPYPMPTPAAPPPPVLDYTQQLLATLQAWRQYLEQSASSSVPAPPQVQYTEPTAQSAAREPVQPTDDTASKTERPHVASVDASKSFRTQPARRPGTAYFAAESPVEVTASYSVDSQSGARSLYGAAGIANGPESGVVTPWWESGQVRRPSSNNPQGEPETQPVAMNMTATPQSDKPSSSAMQLLRPSRPGDSMQTEVNVFKGVI
jgi:hypothetical protein